jgi:hypothetical protein
VTINVAKTRERDPFREITPALKWKEALEDLIDAASEEGVIIDQPEIDCCCGFHSPPDVEIRDVRSNVTEYLDLEK